MTTMVAAVRSRCAPRLLRLRGRRSRSVLLKLRKRRLCSLEVARLQRFPDRLEILRDNNYCEILQGSEEWLSFVRDSNRLPPAK